MGKRLPTRAELQEEVQRLRERIAELERTSSVPPVAHKPPLTPDSACPHDRAPVEHELRHARENLQNLFDALDDMLFILSPEGVILYVNPSVVRTLGYSQEELRGRTVTAVHPPDRHAEAHEIIRDLVAGTRAMCPIPVLTRDGREIPVETRVAHGTWDGQPVLFGVSRDISGRIRTENALRESEQRFQLAVQGSTDGLWDWPGTSDGTAWWSPRYYELLGFVPGEVDANFLDLHARLHPDDQAAIMEAIRAHLEERRPYDVEYRLRRKSGDYRWFRSRGQAHWDAAGRPVRMSGSLQDIHDRKQAEQTIRENEARFREVLESSRHCLYRFNLRTDQYDYISPSIEQLLGYRHDEFLRKPWADTLAEVHPDDLSALLRDVELAKAQRAGPKASITVEYRRRHRNGEYRWINDWATFLFDDQGQCQAIVGSAYDITERKLAEDQRRRLDAQLQHAQKIEAIGQLAGGIAHEFNNLLTAIFGYVELARKTLEPEHSAIRSLERVVEAAEQASGVTHSLLTFSRRTPTEKHVANVASLIEKATRLLERVLPAGITLKTEVPRMPLYVRADATQLQQVLLNLAINARDAMPEGGELRISARRAPPRGSHDDNPDVQLVVRDTGVGISPRDLPHIFEPFFTTKPPERGTGLGLAITVGIVEDHAGRIDVASQPGEGATFTVTLPAVDSALVHEAAKPAPEVPRGEGELILLAEDDQHVRRIIASALQSLNYEVLPVGDGRALLEAFAERRDRVRLLVTDLEMPQRQGLDCLADLRAAGVRVPAILMTATVDAAVEDDLDDDTVLLRKPFHLSALGVLVGHLLQR